MKTNRKSFVALVLVAIASTFLGACGKSPNAPSANPTPIPDPIRPVLVIQGNPAAPVSGTATVNGRVYPVENGQATLEVNTIGADVKIVVAGYLDRTVKVAGNNQNVELTYLIPGLDAEGYRYLAYRAPTGVNVGIRHARPNTAFLLQVAADIWNDASAMNYVNGAVAGFNRLGASQGISLQAVLEGSASSPNSVRFYIDVSDPNLQGGAFWGVTSNNIDSAGFITGGSIVLYHMTAVRSRTSAHELGHSLGFWHSNNSSDLMYPGGSGQSFTDVETYVAGAMLRRAVKTSWVDADPGTLGAASLSVGAHIETIVCGH